MLFRVLYSRDMSMTQFYVAQSMERLEAPWCKREFEPDTARVLFFLLLDKDMQLKQAVLDGLPKLCVDPLPARTAEGFFLALREEVIEPWLSQEKMTPEKFVEMVTHLYLAV